MGFRSIWVKIAQSLVVNFVFRREVELQSFYSAILIPSPHYCIVALEIQRRTLGWFALQLRETDNQASGQIK